MNKIEKELGGVFNFIQLIALLLIFPVILYWVWIWIFEYNVWQKTFAAAWIVVVCYWFNLIPGFPPY